MEQDFYRLHTFANKGPNRREVRDYHRFKLGVFLPHGSRKLPLTTDQIDRAFAKAREEGSPIASVG
jgi:hypothetical protein